jgi:hypothetical protein
MKMDINQLRAAFGGNENKNENGSNYQNDYYPFWFMPVDSQAVIRFLPDANESNKMGFLVEKRMHELTINGQKRKVPCLYPHEGKCPICDASKSFYDAGDETNGKKYWRKQSYVAQALVMENPIAVGEGDQQLKEDPVGKVKLVSITYTLYKIIKDAFESGELDEPPFFFDGGTNFIIKKDKQGDYASYVLSNFSRKSTDLTDAEVEVCQENMRDLSTALPKPYTYEKLQAMLEADMTGTEYVDPDKQDNAGQAAPSQTPAETPAQAETSAPEAAPAKTEAAPEPTPESEAPASTGDSAQDRARAAIEAVKRQRQG